MSDFVEIIKIGLVKKNENTQLEIYPKYQNGLLGLIQYSHITVCYWLHENDTEKDREVLRVHPKANPKNPITGVFATRSPKRPNPLGISVCEIFSVEKNIISIKTIDARNNSPILDIKGYCSNLDKDKIIVPEWIR